MTNPEEPVQPASDSPLGGVKILKFSREQVAPPKPEIPPLLKPVSGLLQNSFPPLTWVVPNLIPAGVMLLSGAPKIGKSYAALDLCVAVSCGGYAFGKIPVDKARVAYFALEDNDRRFHRRVSVALRQENCPGGFDYNTVAPRLDEGLVDRLDEEITRNDTRLIVIDTLKMIRPEEKEKTKIYDGDYSSGRWFIELSAAHPDVAVVLITHNNKSKSEDDLDLISGSTGLAGGVDNVMIMKRGRGQGIAELYVTGRDIEREGRYEMSWCSETSQWTIDDNGMQVGMPQEQKRVYVCIRDHGPIRAKDITTKLYGIEPKDKNDKNWARVRSQLNVLRKRGLVFMDEDSRFNVSL